MTRGFDNEAFLYFAAWVFPALGVVLSLLLTVYIARRSLARMRAIRADTKHWRDETHRMWEDICADKTVQFRRQIPGRPLTVEDQQAGLQQRPGQRKARHRLAEPQERSFRGQLPNNEAR